jgi:chromosome segregation ATPase
MKKVFTILTAAALCSLAACVQNSAEYKNLKAENDSIRLENAQQNAQLEELMTVLNDIETDFQSIRTAENYLNAPQTANGELTPSAREQIENNMSLIKETLAKNREQIDKLENLLKKSNMQSDALKKTVERLSSELEQKTIMIVALQEELEKKNVHIDELNRTVSSLKDDMEKLATDFDAQTKKVKEQDAELNKAYYCFGTSKELKDQKILTGGGLFSKSKALQGDFNRSYFVEIDVRKVTEIELYSHKASLKSNHPANSYEFSKDKDGNLVFKIIDPKVFWSLGRYLVIEVS